MRFCIIMEFFVPYYNGGGERRFYELTKRLVEKGHDVDVLTMKFENAPDSEVVNGVNIHHIGPVIKNPPIRSKKDFIIYFKEVLKWFRKNKYDIIDAQSYSPLISGVIASKIHKTPVIGTIYDTSSTKDDQWVQSSPLAKFAEKRLVSLPFNKILTISNSTKSSLIEKFDIDNNHIELMYIGIDFESIDNVKCENKDENTILFVGRLIPHKHADHLLKIINNIKNDMPDIKLRIVGKGIEKDNLVEYINSNDLNEYVEFYQDLSNEELIYQMKKASVLVLPSTREGFGMVLTEANACYTPTIAYSSGGVVEVVNNNETGFLVEPENIAELEEKIRYVLENDDVRLQLGEQGRKNVEEKFDWDKLVLQYIELSKSLIN